MELRDFIMLLFLTVAKGSCDVRSSLTFVIDDTASMGEDINQVKESVNDIFDTVLNSNSSQIEDFIIVTFNDPGTYLRVKTKDREDFKRALSQISVHGGGLCPELAMEGIEMGLDVSREGSLIYVYTDASAKDHDKFARVEALAQKKRSQIVFILTGDCGSRRSESYLVYPNLARATSGQAFRLAKGDIGQIMAYVRKTIENRKHVLTSKAFPPGNGNTFHVTVDGDTRELIIALSGSHLVVIVTNSKGTRMPTEDITRLSEVLIVNVLGVKPDVYTVGVNSTTDTTVVVSGTTTVHFQHGFSVSEPTSLNDTNVKPFLGVDSYISIKLSSEGGHVFLASVQILDMDQHVLLDIPLNVVDEDEQFYATNETVDLPDHTFLIAIKGFDSESESSLTRISLTPIKPQLESFSVKAPLISIDGGDKINAAFNAPLQLKCQVTAYPKPDIIWVSADTITTFNIGETTTVEFPYVYASVLKIDEVKTNTTFTCLATNNQGSDSRSIAIETKIEFFNILEMPSDTTIEHHEQRQIRCEVDAMPPATVYWYKRRRRLIPDGNLEISANATILTINSMEPYLVDNYTCIVRNDFNRTKKKFRIDISGFEAPVINKDDYFVLAMRHSPTSITCNVTKGEPRPNITWSYNYDYSTHFHELSETGETIYIDDADVVHAGLYRCLAKNAAGEDHHDIQLSVEYPPTRTGVFKTRRNVNNGTRVTLHCPVSAIPTPSFAWTFNGNKLPESHKNYSDGTLRFIATLGDEGYYECVAKNTHGQIRLRTYVTVIVPPTIEPPEYSLIEVPTGEKLFFLLLCRAHGSPKPDITWVFNSRDPAISSKNFMPSNALGALNVSVTGVNQDGFYTCSASNAGGSTNITYTIIVKAPPPIVNRVKHFTAVVGDAMVHIPCTALGNPKPAITWSKNEDNLASGSSWYEILEDGSLIIKNVDTESAGTYVCTATNEVGEDSEHFELEVSLYPDPGFLADVLTLEEGASNSIDCPILHDPTDRLRWFKDGNLLPDEPLNIDNVTENDAGVYTCRTSGFAGTQTRSIKVEVVCKPKFIADAIRNINYESGNYASMDCDATALPEPEVEWLKDGNTIDFTGFIYEFEMTSTDEIGRYTCVVKNRLGSIQRDFDISTEECVLDTASDFDGNNPLMLTQYWEFTNFENIDGFIHIPKEENIILACPGEFEGIPSGDVLVTCVGDKEFSYEGRLFSFAELKCRDKIEPTVSRTGRICGRTLVNSEEIRVGFAIGEHFVDVYEVCVDRGTNKTLYTKQNIQPYLANALPENPIEWFNDGPPVDLDGLYDCEYQNNMMSSILRMNFHKRDRCCFANRQLVDPRDVPPGLAQAATYTHLNVAPYWGTCNTKNWEEVEQRIRDLVISADHELQVWSGTAQKLDLLGADNRLQNIKFSDRGKEYQVAKYFWKVIQDPVSKSSLAIIQVNVPDLKLTPQNYVLCRDVCSEVTWMRYRRWHNPGRGFTYCCSLQDFLKKFRIADVFHRYRNLLKAVSSLPSESSALHII